MFLALGFFLGGEGGWGDTADRGGEDVAAGAGAVVVGGDPEVDVLGEGGVEGAQAGYGCATVWE